ncbi:hypothetical protein GALMADRAFT_154971 [Galerina marginata CBS 339.88]|uniref:F-box domain-containing protein n=1 Tax=Galerina marginata (strain CBS 339.88) TaxID=685588 RepID=A0A067T6F3_GALM3|nr:hypothetical protein GALMADRAFT_154971 [Galerina marginata CBS 339.88]
METSGAVTTMNQDVYPHRRTTVNNLAPDILWLIFMFNTIPVDYSPLSRAPNNLPLLTVARRTSQVCHSWRQITLDSSSLWGRLVDLNVLFENNRGWVDEVLLRAKDAPLWITGKVRPEYLNDALFFSLVERNWERVQKIEVSTYGIRNDDVRWNVCLRPAPALKDFGVYIESCEYLLNDSQDPVFANDAPSLRNFGSFQIPFPIDAPWLSELKNITFPQTWSMTQVLDLCSRMPCLVELIADHTSPFTLNSAYSDSLPHINLPHLIYITLRGELRTCLKFLEHITASPACLVSMASFDHNTKTLTPTVVESTPKILSRWVTDYFTHYEVNRVRLQKSRFGVVFEADFNLLSDDWGFLSDFHCWDAYKPDAELSLLASFVPMSSMMSRYSLVTELRVDFAIPPSLYSAWKFIFDCLPSIEVLKASHSSFQHLIVLESMKGARVPNFPALRELEIFIETEGDTGVVDLTDIPAFLKWYKCAGKPLALLTLVDTQGEREMNIGVLNCKETKGMTMRRKTRQPGKRRGP